MEKENGNLSGKTVCLLGGNGLIGKAVAKGIRKAGGNCVIADLQVEGEPSAIKTDITSSDSIDSLIEKVKSEHGSIDACINVSYPRNDAWGKKFEDVSLEDFSENARLHLGGYFIAAQRFCRFFKQQGHGNLILTASIQGQAAPKFSHYEGLKVGDKEMTSPAEYSIFKAGLINFGRYLAAYYKNNNIRVNVVSPGGIENGQPEEFQRRYRGDCLDKGMLAAEDMVGTYVFLASEESRYINGQNLTVDDGWLL